MKKVLLGFFMLLSFGIYGQDFKKLDDKNIDSKQMEFAKKFAIEYFSKQLKGDSYQFNTNEATEEMIKMLTPDKQIEVYNQLKSGFGDFKSLEYAQTWVDKNSNLIVYRFKATFGEANKLEIRVVLNYKGLIAGFFVKPWSENLQ